MTFNLKVKDFVEIKEVLTSFSTDDLIHIGKRYKNNKRDFLFINKYLGKHIPVEGSRVLELFDEFYDEIERNINLHNKKILIVGFAETATALAQHVMYRGINSNKFDSVFYIQTTRETFSQEVYDKYKNLSFEEEHSHATTQMLMFNEEIVPEYDLVLFIEDEITTGNTILNFIKKFKEINSNTEFAVASILNFQSESHVKTFEDNNISTIYLIKGNLRQKTPEITLNRKDKPIDLFSNKKNNTSKNVISESSLDPRLGLRKNEFKDYINEHLEIASSLYKREDMTIDSEVIGTEEFMYVPILFAQRFGMKVRSTTRSPILISEEEGYIVNNGVVIPSFYEDERKTFLYNLDDKKRLVFLTDSKTGEHVPELITKKWILYKK